MICLKKMSKIRRCRRKTTGRSLKNDLLKLEMNPFQNFSFFFLNFSLFSPCSLVGVNGPPLDFLASSRLTASGLGVSPLTPSLGVSPLTPSLGGLGDPLNYRVSPYMEGLYSSLHTSPQTSLLLSPLDSRGGLLKIKLFTLNKRIILTYYFFIIIFYSLATAVSFGLKRWVFYLLFYLQ